MAYDKKAYAAWEKQCPDATDEDKENVKALYATDQDDPQEPAPAPASPPAPKTK